ncbi:hypothetical protein AVEN_94622-1 [Araneus ventricosus]|uniref:PiggyBac transposable element-derived protein domain-containing protein n=1 Tax=Araneus ventricosus TaxID=182803 RepID=A0A4Y2MGA0_ARAVE|nr:hypothetical protein AVEN_94622-1 [Araneus ventricosus]
MALEFLPSKDNEVYSSLLDSKKMLTMVSYVTRKNKTVVLVSSTHEDSKVDDISKKTDIILEYNKYKCGVYVANQLRANYTVARKTNRWPLVIIFAFLKVAEIIEEILLMKCQPDTLSQPRRFFLNTLATSLMKPQINLRKMIKCFPIHEKFVARNWTRKDMRAP